MVNVVVANNVAFRSENGSLVGELSDHGSGDGGGLDGDPASGGDLGVRGKSDGSHCCLFQVVFQVEFELLFELLLEDDFSLGDGTYLYLVWG